MKPGLRWTFLSIGIAGTVYLAFFSERNDVDADIVSAEVRSGPSIGTQRTKAPAEPEPVLEIKSRVAGDTKGGRLFGPTVWAVPAKVVPEAAPPAPAAPALPFTFIGKRSDGGAWEVFVTAGDRTLILRENESIDATYRVDSIQPPRLVLTYLPMNVQQTMNIGTD